MFDKSKNCYIYKLIILLKCCMSLFILFQSTAIANRHTAHDPIIENNTCTFNSNNLV